MLKKILWLVVVIIIISVGLFWSNKDQWLADFNQERQQQAAHFTQEGRTFAQNADQQQCLEQGFKQLGNCFSFDCTLDQGTFVKSCLAHAQPAARFCSGVPEYREKLTEDDKYWLKDGCWDKNLNGDSCKFLLKQQIYFCSTQP